MAVRLNAWLAETFEWQLVLANHWLQERHEKKKSGVKTERDRAWDGLYHDNGSCLEIINSIHPERNSALQVLETVPWTLTDGQHHVVAHLTPDCARDFETRYPTVSYLSPGSTIAVRKYTIQSTSYGPLYRRLRFLLHHIEWVGHTASHLTSVDLVSLYHHGAIGAVQEQLRKTRAREDRRCLSVGDAQTNDTMARDSREVPDIGSQLLSQMRHTQEPFETQMQRATPAHSDSSDAQSIRTNTLAPVTLPNRHTKCVEIRQDQEATQYEQLRSLLHSLHQHPERGPPTGLKPAFAGPKKRAVRLSSDQPTAQGQGWIMSSFAKAPSSDAAFLDPGYLVPENLGPDAQATAPSPRELEGWEANIKKEPQPHNSLAHSGEEALPHISKNREAIDSAEENNKESTESAEGHGTRKATSSTKGHSNKETTDSVEGHSDGEDTGSDEGQDDRAAHIVPEQDTASSPECSWMKGFIFNSDTLKVSSLQQQCLKKDTSWLHPPPGCPPFQDGNMPQSILAVLHRIADERASAEDDATSDADSDIDPSPDSLPMSVNLSAEPVPQTTQENNETDEEGIVSQWSTSPESPQRPLRSYQDLPPDSSPVIQKSSAEQPSKMSPKSSVKQPQHSEVVALSGDEPLAVQNLAISDDEMEMEEFIPQALGEDLPEKTGPRTETPIVFSPKPTQLQPVVQVKETPYGKGKTAQRTDGISPCRPDPKQTPHPSGTSKNKSSCSIVHSTSTNPQAPSSAGIAQDSTDKRYTTQTDQRTVSQVRKEAQDETVRNGAIHASEDVQMADELLQTEETASLSGTTPTPLRLQGLAPSLYSSTPETVSRSTKRKLPASPARGNRGKSRRREIRLIGFGDDPPPTVDPRVTLSEERAESLRRFREERNSITSFESLDLPTKTLKDIRSTYDQNMEVLDLDSADMLSNEPHYETVFESFKAAYPEYTGNRIHFHNLCEKMYRWDLEDKMVPKWQWDDFIIRDRTDFCNYAMKCIDRAESPGPYYRFYKDKIRDTLYCKGIIQGRETLEQALREGMNASGGPPKIPLPSRKSLPGPFDQMIEPRQSAVTVSHARPRQSLPARLHAQQGHRQGTPSTSSYQTLRDQARTPRPSQPETTGDPYADFYADYQRRYKNQG